MKIITFREADKILKLYGFVPDKIKGSHHHYLRNGKRIVINLDINPCVWRRLCKENNLPVEKE